MGLHPRANAPEAQQANADFEGLGIAHEAEYHVLPHTPELDRELRPVGRWNVRGKPMLLLGHEFHLVLELQLLIVVPSDRRQEGRSGEEEEEEEDDDDNAGRHGPTFPVACSFAPIAIE